MNKYTLTLLCILTCGFCFSATAQSNIIETKNPCAEVYSEDGGFITDPKAVIVEPSYKGGDKKLYKFLSENVSYPDKAIERRITGTVLLKFVVEKDGSITNIEIARSVARDIDEECIRVVKKMPRWKPGTVNGKPAKFRYCLPIAFDLQ